MICRCRKLRKKKEAKIDIKLTFRNRKNSLLLLKCAFLFCNKTLICFCFFPFENTRNIWFILGNTSVWIAGVDLWWRQSVQGTHWKIPFFIVGVTSGHQSKPGTGEGWSKSTPHSHQGLNRVSKDADSCINIKQEVNWTDLVSNSYEELLTFTCP